MITLIITHPTTILYILLALVYCAAARCALTGEHRRLAFAYGLIGLLYLGVSACHALDLG